MPVRARQAALWTVGVRRNEPIGRPITLSLNGNSQMNLFKGMSSSCYGRTYVRTRVRDLIQKAG